MAVYTNLGAESLARIIEAFDVGTLTSAKGIAEGVSNSNWLIETRRDSGKLARFILTMYEDRTDLADLPFFLGLLDHLAAKGCPVPRTIHDRQDRAFSMHDGKALALIEFLPGVSVSRPTPAQARAVGEALASIHLEAADFGQQRANTMRLGSWKQLLAACSEEGLASIDEGFGARMHTELAYLEANWPDALPRSVIHADLFPDNVLMLGDEVSGLIDFYFACNDLAAFDVAITHAAWCFSDDGVRFDPALSDALLAGYESRRALTPAEREALPVLARGAAMRFIATRAYDWLNTPGDALVTPKNPMAFARRLEFYASPQSDGIFARG